MRLSRRQSFIAGILVVALAVMTGPAQADPSRPDPPRDPAATKPVNPAKPVTPAKPATPAVAGITGSANYAYDATGRLVGVGHPGGDTARYSYDAAGNVTGVQRYPSSQVSVLSVVPASARPGATVTISGTGFAATPAGNQVSFHGAAATVTAATPTALTVTVPAGATSGNVTVTAGGASASAAFTLAPAGPAVTSVSPATAPPTTEVTINGAGFDSTLSNNVVRINGVAAEVFEATPQQLKIRVPLSASSGALEVATPAGTTRMTGDFVIPPTGVDPEHIESVTRIEAGAEPALVRIATAGKVALVLVDAPEGRRFSVGLTDISLTSGYLDTDVIDPRGTVVADGSDYDPYDVDVSGTRAGDTYQLVIDPQHATATGEVRVSVAAPVTGELDPAGGGRVAALTSPGQDVRLGFEASRGEAVGLGFTANSVPKYTDVKVFSPSGVAVENSWSLSSTSSDALRLTNLPETGRYEVALDPSSAAVGSITTTYSKRHDGGRLDPAGAGSVVDIQRAGQDAELRFDGTAGQAANFGWDGNTIPEATYVSVLGPDGEVVVDREYVSAEDSGGVDVAALPATGTYRVLVAPREAATGRITITYSRRLDAGRLDPAAAGSVVDIQRLGQDAELTFDGTAGEHTSLGVTDNTFPSHQYISVFGPTGATLVDREYISSRDTDSLALPALPATGAYRVVVAPAYGVVGRHTLTYSRRIDAGVLARTGNGSAVNVARPGQDAGARFDAAIGESVSVGVTNNTSTETMYVTVVAPDGTTLVDRRSISRRASDSVDLVNLSAGGTYQIVIGPGSGGTGGFTLTLSTPLDAGELVVGAAGRAIAVPRAGQDANLRFTGTAGQKLRISYSGDTYPAGVYVSVVSPTGGVVVNRRWLRRTNTYDIPDLPVAGTYSMVVDPDDAGTGQIVFALVTRTAAAAPPPVEKSSLAAVLRKRKTAVAPVVKEQQGSGPETWTPDRHSLTGGDWLTRRAAPRKPTPLTARPGVTALAGHVLTVEGRPLRNVSVRVGQVSGRTDGAGRFLLAGVKTGKGVLVVDGAAASSRGRWFGVFHIKVEPAKGRTTVLPFTIWMQRLDTAHTVKFPSPTTRETVLTTPKVPGLEVRLPAGSVVRDGAGKVVTELGITPIPIDRSPFPLPKNGIVPVYFTVQPGGTYVFPDGAQIIYPNYTRLPAGKRVDFWDYDPQDKGWYVYGHGRVSADAKQVVPDKDTKVWAFHGAMFNTSDLLPFDISSLKDLIDWLSGDPVELSTGRMVDHRTDLALDDTMPISLTRTLWQGDTRDREFGVGQLGQYGMFLNSQEQYQEVDLYLPGGGKVHYVRTSAGTGYSDAVFDARGTAGEFRNSRIAWNSQGGWNLTLRNGTTYVFPMYAPLQAIRDRNGNQITLTRRNGNTGPISQITSPNGRWIKLSYDDDGRTTGARDVIGRTVGYTYDGEGRLETVTDPAGQTIRYAYDAAGSRPHDHRRPGHRVLHQHLRQRRPGRAAGPRRRAVLHLRLHRDRRSDQRDPGDAAGRHGPAGDVRRRRAR